MGARRAPENGLNLSESEWGAAKPRRSISSFPKRHAIERARFFLEKAEGCGVDQKDQFEAYLETAIVWARAAIHRLQSTYRKEPGWKEWFESLLDDPAVNFFRNERNFIIKEAPSKVGQIISFNPIQKAKELYYYEDPAEPASDTVREHLERVEATVIEGEDKFGS